jgi:hypothetical protein
MPGHGDEVDPVVLGDSDDLLGWIVGAADKASRPIIWQPIPRHEFV